MQKDVKHGKEGSPFGGGVTQYPDKPDDTVEVKAPAEEPPEEPPTKDGSSKSVLAAIETKSGLSLKNSTLPTILDFIPDSTIKLLSEDQKKAVSTSLHNLGYWMEAAMICKDHDCAFKDKCNLFKAKIPRPVGEDCPVELMQARAYKMMLTGSLSDEDQEDPFLMIQINDVVHVMMIEARAHGQFGIDGGVIEVDDVRGFNPVSGQDVIAKVVHRAISIIEKMGKRKDRLLSKLLATPQDRAKADRDGVFDRSKKAAEIGARVAKVAKEQKGRMKREKFIVERIEVEETTAIVVDIPKED